VKYRIEYEIGDRYVLIYQEDNKYIKETQKNIEFYEKFDINFIILIKLNEI
jgi:hypothetical protein